MREFNQKAVSINDDLKMKLKTVGENIKLARLRRSIGAAELSGRAEISRKTLWKIENGDPSVAIGFYVKILDELGLSGDIVTVAKEDKVGRLIQDSFLIS